MLFLCTISMADLIVDISLIDLNHKKFDCVLNNDINVSTDEQLEIVKKLKPKTSSVMNGVFTSLINTDQYRCCAFLKKIIKKLCPSDSQFSWTKIKFYRIFNLV